MSGRIRSMKPEWLDDEKLARCSDAARTLSTGLILMSDDYGNGRGALGHIATRVWGYHIEDSNDPREVFAKAARALRELVEMGYVTLYNVDGQRYFSLRNWKRHQRVDKPGKPLVPSPDRGIPETLARDSRDLRETLAPDLDQDQDQEGRGSGGAPPDSRESPEHPPDPSRPPVDAPARPSSLAPMLAGLYAEERARLHPALPPYELFQRDRASWDAVARTVVAHAARHELDVRDVARSVVQRFLELPELAKHAWPPRFLGDRVETLLGALATVSAAAATAATDPLLAELRELDARMEQLRVTPGTELERIEVQKRLDEVVHERRRQRARPEAST